MRLLMDSGLIGTWGGALVLLHVSKRHSGAQVRSMV